jgi:hypothetical protein
MSLPSLLEVPSGFSLSSLLEVPPPGLSFSQVGLFLFKNHSIVL